MTSGRPKKVLKALAGKDDGSGDEMVNIPPAKARKTRKDQDRRAKDITNIFSDEDIVSQPRKLKVVQGSDDDFEPDSPGSRHDHPGSSTQKAEVQATLKKDPAPVPFRWNPDSDIPATCPEEDCADKVIANLSPSLVALFRSRAKVIHECGNNADAIYAINIKICAQLKIERTTDHRRRRAEKRGLVNVDLQLLANRIWDLKDTIDPFMSSPTARSGTFIWATLLDDLNLHNYSVTRLNKGKDVPHAICATARPG
jgi:hypothetical protein